MSSDSYIEEALKYCDPARPDLINYKKALDILESASNDGFEAAHYICGMFYAHGYVGEEPDLCKAQEYFMRGIKHNNLECARRYLEYANSDTEGIEQALEVLKENGDNFWAAVYRNRMS